MILDTRTLVIVACGLAVSAALTFAFSWRFNRDIDALRYWVWAYLLNAVGLALIAVNSGAAPWLLMGSNFAVNFAALLMLYGSRSFLGQPLPSHLHSALLAAVTGGLAYFIYVDFDYIRRVQIVSAYLGVVPLLTAMTHFRSPLFRTSGPVRVMGLVMTIHGATMVARLYFFTFYEAAETSLLHISAAQSILFFEACVMIAAVPIACLLMIAERLHENLRRMATTDDLTGLLNRRAFLDEARRHFARVQRQNMPLSVLMLDIDRFKKINDAKGHDAGDAVLAAFADTLRMGLRRSDLPCRYGGEEFCVLLPDTDMDGAAKLAENLRRRFATVEVEFDGAVLGATISIGVAEAQPAMHMVEEAISRADRALYAAKRAGRNCVIRFEPSEDGAPPSLSYRSRPLPAARSAVS